jgi:hypothetical protein
MASHVPCTASAFSIDEWIHTLEGWENTRKNKLWPPQY